MTRATKTPPKTWLDLLPPGVPEPPAESLLTRAELIEHQDADESDLRYWEYIGVLPRPVRRWHNGATRALYPPILYVVGIRNIRLLQKNGVPLDEMGEPVQHLMAIFAAYGAGLPDDEAAEAFRAYMRARESNADLAPQTVFDLRQLGRARSELTGVPTDRIEVRVIGVDDRKTTYTIDAGGDELTPNEST